LETEKELAVPLKSEENIDTETDVKVNPNTYTTTTNSVSMPKSKEISQTSQQQEIKNNIIFNPFIIYIILWQQIISDWINIYYDFLSNITKINRSWCNKSQDIGLSN
jgi:hypothetical protein